MTAEDDRIALARRAAGGDEVALKTLLIQTLPRLCERLRRRIPADLARTIDVQDVVQEAHVEVFRRIDTFEVRQADSFERWLFTIALSRLRNTIKKHRAAKRGGAKPAMGAWDKRYDDSTIALFEMVAGPGRTPSRSIARREAIAAVQSGLGNLPAHYRQAIWLVHIEGRSVKDAATQMGRTERAIHGLCRRGLSLLQEQLGTASRFLSSDD